jgi:polyisoprenoid-binding protein YceI
MNAKITRLFLITALAGLAFRGMSAQVRTIYTSRAADASFFSSAPLEDIKAGTNRASAAMNTRTGEVLFVVPVKSFVFEKNLMQEHFNEQYMESDRYPEARFDGVIVNWQGLPETKTEISVRGKLTIHGITRQVTEKATLEPAGDGFLGSSTFQVRLVDYNIRIPRILTRNIAEEVQVTVSAEFRPL